ncbi:MAG: DUF4157 domain-containing protein [Moorea sp. SIO3I7]|nr:DUF4157 domain-containing protein [Moorena sp. SIO3I7]NEO08730.1 DUF4157 domain-containing protein [Moorena sp. SIO3I8]
MSANVMRTLESGVTQPERGRREMGRQAKFSFGQPGVRSRQGANHGGHQVVQPKRIMVQRTAQPLAGDTVITGESLRASRSDNQNKTGMPDRLKAGIENLSGYSMDDVRVHYNSDKPAQLNALAYAQGTDIHVGPGQEKHLAHEAWHVVQQMEGRVRPGRQKFGLQINEETGLEKEAEEMGKKAWQKLGRRKEKTNEQNSEREAVGNTKRKRILLKEEQVTTNRNHVQIYPNLKMFSRVEDELRDKELCSTTKLIQKMVKDENVMIEVDEDYSTTRVKQELTDEWKATCESIVLYKKFKDCMVLDFGKGNCHGYVFSGGADPDRTKSDLKVDNLVYQYNNVLIDREITVYIKQGRIDHTAIGHGSDALHKIANGLSNGYGPVIKCDTKEYMEACNYEKMYEFPKDIERYRKDLLR